MQSEGTVVHGGYLSVGLTDAPADALKEIWVTIESLEFRTCEEPGKVLLPLLAPVSFELLSYKDKIGSLLPAGKFPAGKICDLRVNVQDDDAYVVDQEGKEFPLKVPSGEVKLKGEITVADGVFTAIVLDFDAEKSLHQTGQGKFILHPVISIKSVTYTPWAGPSLDGHTLLGGTTIHVTPDTNAVFDLGGGASISFPSGAVADAIDFTVTRWRRPSTAAIGEVIRFWPPYDFAEKPVLSMPLSGAVAPTSIFLDSHPVPTDCTDTECTASIAHFSDTELCVKFKDIPEGQWYSAPVYQAACAGLIRGYDDGTNEFRPSNTITRAELLMILARLASQDENVALYKGEAPFGDVKEGDWFYGPVAWAVDKKILLGDAFFNPHLPATREWAAEVFVLAAKAFSGDEGGAKPVFGSLYSEHWTDGPAPEPFADVLPDSYYYPYINTMRTARLMTGYGDTNDFGPDKNLIRAEVAKIACFAGGFCGTLGLAERLFCPSPSGECTELMKTVEVTTDYLDPWAADGSFPHPGVDFGGSHKIYAPVSGTIEAADAAPCGKVVLSEKDASSRRHVFFHMEGIDVKKGDSVETGDFLGISSNVADGKSCFAYGKHLHYEVRIDYTGTSGCCDFKAGDTDEIKTENWDIARSKTANPHSYEFPAK